MNRIITTALAEPRPEVVRTKLKRCSLKKGIGLSQHVDPKLFRSDFNITPPIKVTFLCLL
jgi:hypothetical protein